MDQPDKTATTPDAGAELEAAVDQVVAACDGKPVNPFLVARPRRE